MRKPIICLDFDGVINSYKSGWQGVTVLPDQPVEGALQWIVAALDHYTVVILSSRSHQWGGRRAMKRWLKEHLCELASDYKKTPMWWSSRIARTMFTDPWKDEVRYATELVIKEIKWPMFKPAALITIDDRAVCFTGTFPSLAEIASFQPWYRKKS